MSEAYQTNEIVFDEEHLGDINAIGATLFGGDPSDPRSWNYQRKLVRPKIRWWKITLFIVLLLAGSIGGYFLLCALSVPSGLSVWFCIAGALIVLLLYMKRILICFVRIYQRFAPDSVRMKCRFEPSCSQYMILSLQKYGLWKGLFKGIDRLKRCRAKDGGFDEP